MKALAIALVLISNFLLISCIPQRKLNLLQTQEVNDSSYVNSFITDDSILTEYLIQPNDYLYINIRTIEKELSDFLEPGSGMNFINSENQSLLGYNVNNEGYIYFPYLGDIKLAGLTMMEAHNAIKASATKILGDRVRIDVKLINNTINVLGEVNKEGQYNMTKGKITIIEALTIAGGLTNYAKRQQIKVYRKINNKEMVYLVDITSGDLVKNMFYVYPNDMIYVEAMRAKSFGLSPTFSITMISSMLTTVVAIMVLFKGIN
ncbi:MAG: polysaccharide biosynthesis/export family protein [Lentimicrobium sp.]|nr:polysaccharide biosynthesis/export family protein [Lentimicrobium sp.]